MKEKEKVMNKWFVVFGAVMVQVCIGAIYSWSLFNQPLMDKFDWTKDQVILTYSIAIFVFAFSTIFSGRLQDRFGPRIVATIGGVLYGCGLLLASTATSLTMLYISYGILAGAGVGFAYVCPLSTCVKWFPEKRGFITGIAVGAFGMGSLVFKEVIESLLNSLGVSLTFFYIGIIYMVLVIGGAQLLRLPPKDYGKTDNNISKANGNETFTVGQMMQTKAFYLIFIMFLFACTSGLLVIGLAKDIGVQLAGLEPSVAANAVAMIALFNAGGRLSWGTLSDKIGRLKAIFFMFIITAASMIVMSVINLNYFIFFACLAGIAFCFGGFLAVFPTITGDFYGIKTLGSNYGVVYQAYGIAALAGPLIVRIVGGLKPTFMISAILAIIGCILTIMVKQPTLDASL